MIEIYTDGGARGNPGPAAAGVVIGAPYNKSYSQYLGETTNNIAEYQAVILALEKLRALVGKGKTKSTDVTVFMDSQLAVQQLSGRYKVNSENIIPLFIKIHNLRVDYRSVAFQHVPRAQNKGADKMVNQELDKHEGSGSLFSS
ncbi:MAG: ribonuclease HI family protein [Candidatus Spechtbacterales bacterium]